jgi:hypothetical protein
MTPEYFVAGLGVMLAVFLTWGFRVLPREKWQILCSVPTRKMGAHDWFGVNLTFYGLFNATSVVFSGALFVFLLASVNIPVSGIFIVLSAVLAVCVPASKVIARIVEKKPSTLSVGGASFLGFVVAPWLAAAVSAFHGKHVGFTLPVLPTMAALAVSYAFGEGTGRLSCISFGCCYGKPLRHLSPVLQRVFGKYCFVFEGKTKKISYAAGLDGERVVPIQAFTAVTHCCLGLLGFLLFLKGSITAAFLITTAGTQLWRFASEFLRADFRGGGTLSAYQLMNLVVVIHTLLVCAVFPVPDMPTPSLKTGVQAIWNPAVLLFFQGLWLVIFFFTGRSRVTGATLSFHVMNGKI